MKNRDISNKVGDDWATPKELYEKLNSEFGFDFDPCPLHSDFDGLSVEWGGVNFVNPPYTRSIKEAFVKRGVEMQKRGKTSVFLLPVSTSTELFHKVILPNATDIRFLYKRVKFVGVNTKGEKVENSTGQHDSMIVVFKPNGKIFDSHVGLCSTCIACHDMGFDFTGCEIDKDYWGARYQEHTQQQDLFAPDVLFGEERQQELL